MKFHGQSLQNPSFTLFQLPRGHHDPLVLCLRPLPLGFHQRLKLRGIQLPVPPLKIARDSAGRPLRDGQGQAITLLDQRDADYLAALDRYYRCVAVLSVVESLQGESQIHFETCRPDSTAESDWMQYADLIFQELEDAGFTAGDLILLCREICRLSNLIDDHLLQARQNFSPAAAAGPG